MRWLRRLREDRGSGGGLTLIVLVFAMALLMVLGLVVDGGRRAAAYDRANRIAMEAARAGAQALTSDTFAVPVDAAVQQYLAAEGVAGTVTVTPDRVDVTVTLSEPTVMLSMIGVDEFDATGHGFADVIYSGTR